MLQTSLVIYWLTHASLLALIVYSRFDTAVISIAIIVAIFSNLGSGSSPYSAYSIFNKGCRYLLGDVRPYEIDRQIRGGQGMAQGQQVVQDRELLINFPSKYINRPCPCGSGQKAKKCCAANRPTSDKATSHSRRQPQNMNDRNEFEGFEVIQN